MTRARSLARSPLALGVRIPRSRRAWRSTALRITALVIVLAVALACGALRAGLLGSSASAHPSQPTASKWQTYRDPEGYFALEIPAGWKVVVSYNSSFGRTHYPYGIGGVSFQAPIEGMGGYDFDVSVYANHAGVPKPACWWRSPHQMSSEWWRQVQTFLSPPTFDLSDQYDTFTIRDGVALRGYEEMLWPASWGPKPPVSPTTWQALKQAVEHAYATFVPNPGKPHVC